MLRKIALALSAALLLSASAFAQAPQIGAGQVFGNSTAAQRNGRSETVTAILDRALASTRGAIIERGVGGWTALSPGTIGLAFVGAGAGADPLYGIVGLNGGGCNAALTASNGGMLYSTATACAILNGVSTARLPLLSGANTAPVWGAYTLPASVTSGGIACFTSTTVEASSSLLTANAIILGGGAGVCPSPMASLGTTSTVLHGNAAGAPSFGSVVSADLNITTTTCTNQFVTAIGASGTATCTTDTLASAQHANQGTTTTVLHGNAAGNPAFGAIVSADMNITATNCTNQFVSAISTGGIGTCATITQTGTLTAGTAGPGFVIGGVTMTLGTDATGDIYYRNASGILTRLPIGSSTNVLTVSGGLPSWAAPGSGGTVTSVSAGGGIVASPSPITTTGTISLRQATVQKFTTGSGATYTTPAASKFAIISFCAAGGGGAGSGTTTTGGTGGTGGSTVFNGITCTGGVGGTASLSGAGGTCSGGSPDESWAGSNGGNTQTGLAGNFLSGGAGGPTVLFGGSSNGAGVPATGAGGSGGFFSGLGNTGGGGGGGGCGRQIVAGAGATYTYSVGAAGTAGTAGTSGQAGFLGSTGYLQAIEF